MFAAYYNLPELGPRHNCCNNLTPFTKILSPVPPFRLNIVLLYFFLTPKDKHGSDFSTWHRSLEYVVAGPALLSFIILFCETAKPMQCKY